MKSQQKNSSVLNVDLSFSQLRELTEIRNPLFGFTLLVTYLWGFLAHGYGFANLTLSHDSLAEFSGAEEIKYSAGRFIEVLYFKLIRGNSTLPWLAGILGLFWLSLTVWLVIRLFDIRDRILIVLISGILCVNLSVNATAATYIHDLDAYLFAELLAALAALCWAKGGRLRLLMVPLIVAALGIYQSMASVTVSLIIFVCLERLTKGEKVGEVFRDGLWALLLLALSGGLYYAIASYYTSRYSFYLNESLGLMSFWTDKGMAALLPTIGRTYSYWLEAIFMSPSGLSESAALIFRSMILLTGLLTLFALLADRAIPLANKLLSLVLLLLLPLGMNLSYFMNGGTLVHELMHFAFYFLYVLELLGLRHLMRKLKGDEKATFAALVTAVLMLALLLGNVRLANMSYVKKELERQATLSLMTRVSYDMEHTEGYQAGVTKVVFLGTPQLSKMKEFSTNYGVIGQIYTSTIARPGNYEDYYRLILREPINLPDEEEMLKATAEEKYRDIPLYPAEGSIFWEDDTLIVKMS